MVKLGTAPHVAKHLIRVEGVISRVMNKVSGRFGVVPCENMHRVKTLGQCESKQLAPAVKPRQTTAIFG